MKLVIGNLKMNILTIQEREQYFASFKSASKARKFSGTHLVVCPPFVHLEQFAKKIGGKTVSIGAQDVFWEEKGSFTGEISPKMLKNIGCEFVILGHSDRRRYFGETDETVNMKISASLKSNITPVICIGENGDEKKNGRGEETVLKQLNGCLKEISQYQIEKIIICYEPVWAISSNNPQHPPTTDEIMSAKLLIKKFIVDSFGVKIGEKVKIIYGGSVAVNNVKETCIDPGMDGALVGRESLIPSELIKIAEIIDKA